MHVCQVPFLLENLGFIANQRQEISPISHSGDRVIWNDSELSDCGDRATRTEDQIDQAGSLQNP